MQGHVPTGTHWSLCHTFVQVFISIQNKILLYSQHPLIWKKSTSKKCLELYNSLKEGFTQLDFTRPMIQRAASLTQVFHESQGQYDEHCNNDYEEVSSQEPDPMEIVRHHDICSKEMANQSNFCPRLKIWADTSATSSPSGSEKWHEVIDRKSPLNGETAFRTLPEWQLKLQAPNTHNCVFRWQVNIQPKRSTLWNQSDSNSPM